MWFHFKRESIPFWLCVAVVIAAGCGGPSSPPGVQQGTGALFWHLVDNPSTEFSAITVTVTGANLKPCNADWIRHDITPRTLNLLDLQDGAFAEIINMLSLPGGTYCESRLILDLQATVTLLDGSVEPLQMPSASTSGFKIKGTFPIDPAMVTFVTVDFDAQSSVHRDGKKYTLQPVVQVKAVLQFPAPPPGSRAAVVTPDGGGSITDPTFTLSAPPGAVSTPTLIWCQPSPDHVVCGPDGTTFAQPVDVAIKASLGGVIFDDSTKTALITHDGDPIFTVVDETDSWLYGRISHFSELGTLVVHSAEAAFGKYVGDELPAAIGSAGALKSVHLDQGGFHYYHFKKTAGWRQTFCVQADADVDVYTSWFPIVTPMLNGTTQSGSQRFTAGSPGKYECVSLDISESGFLYVLVYGKKSATYTPRLFTTSQTSAPTWLTDPGGNGALRWPLDDCGLVTFEKYGPFNSPWGNGCAENEPFYEWAQHPEQASLLKLHTGVDIACGAGKKVKASCAGKITRIRDAEVNWGKYAVQECTFGAGETVTIAYMHLDNIVVHEGDDLQAGTPIGDIFNMSVKGELDHLHYAVCVGSCTDAYKVRSLDNFDKVIRATDAYQRINPDCHTNPLIFDASTLPAECLASAPYAQGYGYCQ